MLRMITYYNPNRHHPTKLLKDNINPEFFEKTPKRIIKEYRFDDMYKRLSPCNTLKCVRFPDLDNLLNTKQSVLHCTTWLTKDAILMFEGSQKLPNKVSDKYVSDRYGYYHKILNNLRTRACVPTPLDRRTSKELLDKGFYDDYKDFLEFEAPCEEFLEALATLIFMYNKEVKHQFVPIFEIVAKRNAAACKI
jgi:hypothetical protein